MIRNWTYTLFYCVSELWGDVVLSLLFWGFANEITHVDRAPVLYPLFGMGANLAQIAGGIVLRLYSSVEFAKSLKAMTVQMIACMVVIVGLHQWIAHDARVQEKRRKAKSLISGEQNVDWTSGIKNGSGSTREKKSFRESLKDLRESSHIRHLALMAIAQSLSVCLVEFLWKFYLKEAYPTPEALAGFLGDISTATGAITGLLMLTSPVVFKRLGWSQVAGITPTVLTWGGIAFFAACLTYQVAMKLNRVGVGAAVIGPIILFGSSLYVLAKGSKFSLFKPAEEMVYLNLDEESRTKGKAAVDVVGSQLGKSGGSLLQQVV